MEEREVMDVDVLFVGGGVASLSGALHLSNLIQKHNGKVDREGEGKKLDEIMIAVLEKGAYIGAHGISGAVMNPVALRELVPDFLEKGAPLEGDVHKESVYFLTEKGKIKAPLIPPPLNNHGCYVVSIAALNGWLGKLAEDNGVYMFPGFAGTEVLYENERVAGVRTGDKGVDADGTRKPNFEPGIDLRARVTVFGEGARGSLGKTIIKRFGLDRGRNPQNYVVGVKEVWEIPEDRIQPGEVIHSLGYPHKSDTYGGGFIYGMKDRKVSLGLLTGLDYKDPYLDPHREFQKFKLHPFVSDLIKDGKLVQYGAKAAPVGGFFAVPEPTFPGGMLVGDSAGLFISQKIKGVHCAMQSGILSAETIFRCLENDDFSDDRLSVYGRELTAGPMGKELYRSRNFHQAFRNGLWIALMKTGLQYVLGGRILKGRLTAEPDFSALKRVEEVYGLKTPTEKDKGNIKYDGKTTFDKETDVYYSGSTHEEKQASHLKILDLEICHNRCAEEFQNPCLRFCPADVYEMETDEKTGKPGLKLNFSNCVHCKTCDIKDPYENITWVPPEGGGGPKYTVL